MKVKKWNSVLILVFLLVCQVNAQVGIGTNNPQASSILELNSTTQGLLMPRMTNIQRQNIANPTTGLLVYCIDAPTSFYYYDGTQWIRLMNENNTSNGANFINFNSPNVISVTSVMNNGIGNTSLLGNGGSFPGLTISGNQIALSVTQANMAFTIPRNTNIKSLFFNFYNTLSLSLLSPITLRIQIYKANNNDTNFTSVTNATTSLIIPSMISANTPLQSNVTGLNIPVNTGDKLIALISAQSTIASTISGFATASILFD